MYYFKAEIVERYSTWTEFREIEFYKSGVKIPISELSIVSTNLDDTTYVVSRAIDGNNANNGSPTTDDRLYVADQSALPHYIVIKSNVEFDEVWFYDGNFRTGSNNGYASKKILFSISSNGVDWEQQYIGMPTSNISSIIKFKVLFKIKRIVLKNPTTNQHYSLAEKTLIPLPNTSSKNMILHGIEAGKEIQLNEPFDKIRTITDNDDGTQTITDETVEPFSVYDYISENPQVLVYTESTDDIVVSTTTEPYDLYDEFGDEVEVLFYTEDEDATEANLILEANWSPIDELEGDIEIVTWTDESVDTAKRVLEMNAIPKPQFIKLVNPKKIYGDLEDILSVDISESYKDEIRYLFSDKDGQNWYVWDFNARKFLIADASSNDSIQKNGMTKKELDMLTQDDWNKWIFDYMNIGIFLYDNPRDTITSIIDSISYQDYLPRYSTEIEKANFYILNTTAKIDIELVENTIQGILSDDDLSRVQYRVLLNGENYFPEDGSFTKLKNPPFNISLSISSKDIKIDQQNDIVVEFQDSFGTTDSWSASFIGSYHGLLFKSLSDEYYSDDLGNVLKYLDFGLIIAGQNTIEHAVKLKNSYGYDVNNIKILVNKEALQPGVEVKFGTNEISFESLEELNYSDTLHDGEELTFYVRLETKLGLAKPGFGDFDIIVKADRV